MDRDLDPVEVRVLGCLTEKQRTTPDQYPLSLNALRNACHQTTNRNPIVSYDEEGPAVWRDLIDWCVDGVMTARPVAFEKVLRTHPAPEACR